MGLALHVANPSGSSECCICRHLKAHLGKRTHKVNNRSMCRRVRSAQWTYWEKGQDLWVRTGEMLRTLY